MKFKISDVKLNAISFAILIAFAFLFMDASRLDGFGGNAGVFKYSSIVGLAFLIGAINPKKIKGDLLSYLGLGFFLLFTSFYTILESSDLDVLVVLSGYWVAAFIYVVSVSLDPLLEKSLTKAMTIAGVIFLAFNLSYLSDPQAYSLQKQQYAGIFLNANFLAGITSCFLLFFFFKKRNDHRLLVIVDFLAIAVSVVLLAATFSRGAILSVVSVFLLYFAKKGFFRAVFFALIILFFVYFLITGLIDYSGLANRDILEETGRSVIFRTYLDAFQETYLIVGTGVALDSGRIKSELSYLDVMLFAGVGFWGLFLFVGRSIYFVFKQSIQMWSWVEVVFLNIVVISFFEGYAANIASMPSMLFYMLPALIFSKIKIAERGRENLEI